MVNIDEVYQKVLALANKEQRGYITPQEFNLYASQAQLDIFNQYFFDLNQYKRRFSVDKEYSNSDDLINYKISQFKQTTPEFSPSAPYQLPADTYLVTGVFLLYQNAAYKAQEINAEDFSRVNRARLTQGTFTSPNYSISSGGSIVMFPNSTSASANATYIKTPSKPNWQYVVVDEKPLFNSTGANHFELHVSEQKNLVVKILQLAGVGIKDYNIVQATAQEEVKKIQQEKI
tara:strand:+ start:1321 stop:2016 length:696 start_codon:yes stop_codon:yes gene_type:complete